MSTSHALTVVTPIQPDKVKDLDILLLGHRSLEMINEDPCLQELFEILYIRI